MFVQSIADQVIIDTLEVQFLQAKKQHLLSISACSYGPALLP